MGKDESIESPFMKTKVIQKSMNADDLIEKGMHYFALLIKAAKEEGRELEASALQGYIAGFTSTLMIVGFDGKDAVDLGDRLTKAILRVGGIETGCGNPNCTNCNKI
jgi:hypothetical protein